MMVEKYQHIEPEEVIQLLIEPAPEKKVFSMSLERLEGLNDTISYLEKKTQRTSKLWERLNGLKLSAETARDCLQVNNEIERFLDQRTKEDLLKLK